MEKKSFLLVLFLAPIIFIGILFWPNETQAQVTTCSALDQATCTNPLSNYICWPQWCSGLTNNIEGTDYYTEVWCRYRPCQWTGVSCVETPPGDETDALQKACRIPGTNNFEGWVVINEVDDGCVGRKWCDLYQEREYQEHYCEAIGQAAECYYMVTDSDKVEIGCNCNIDSCQAECETDQDCIAKYGEGSQCQECACTLPACPLCQPGEKGGLVPCGRPCNDPDTSWNECDSCQLCHLFIMLDRIIDFVLFTLVPIIAVLMIVIGGAMFMFAHFGGAEMLPGGVKGGPAMLSQAKRLITSVVIGLVIIYGAWLIINTFLTIIGIAEWTGLGNWFQFSCPL